MSELAAIIAKNYRVKNSRKATANYVMVNAKLMDDFMQTCFENKNPYYYKAC